MELDCLLPLLLAVEPIREPRVPLWVLEWGMNLFLSAWLFWVGACVGSFLNVVVYRLPRGKNLAHPGSFCPRCRRPIRLRDNIPLVSWLLLRGRCRDCASPIPARYFLVELATATLFLGVALVEWKLSGDYSNLTAAHPRRLISPYDVLPFWTGYALHVVLLTTLLGAALIDASGHPTPRRMFVPIIVAGLAAGFAWPELRRLAAFSYWVAPWWQAGLIDGLAGLIGGAVIGTIVAAAWWRGSHGTWPRFAPAAMFTAIGVVAGWQVALEAAGAAMLLWLAAIAWQRASASHGIAPLAGFVFVAALPRLTALDVRLGMPLVWPERYVAAIAMSLLAIASFAAWLAGRLAPPPYFAPPPDDPPEIAPPNETDSSETDSSETGSSETDSSEADAQPPVAADAAPENGDASQPEQAAAQDFERPSDSH